MQVSAMRSLLLTWILTFGISAIGALQSPMAHAQRGPQGSADPSEVANAIQKIQKDYADFLAKRDKIQEDYKEVEAKLKKSDEEFQRINSAGLRQQLSAMQSSMQSMQIASVLRSGAATGGQDNTGSNTGSITAIQQQLLLQNRYMQDLNTAMRGEELRQLDAQSQSIVRSRVESMQAQLKLQQEWTQWQQEWPKFMDRYWSLSDLERRFTKSEIEAALEVLDQSNKEDYAGKLAAALLMDRVGRWTEALDLVDEVLKAGTSLGGVAQMTKSLLMTSLNKERDAKQALQAAIKLDKANPYVRWLRARVAASQQQWAIAEPEWRFTSTLKPMELEARRALVLVHYVRSAKSPGEGKKALKEAQSAMELEPVPTWYAHFVLALALHAAKKTDEALAELTKAEEKASDENVERCQQARETLAAGDFYAIDFLNGFADRPGEPE